MAPLIVAVIIAYLLNPLVSWLTNHTRLNRDFSAAVIYIAFLLILSMIPFLGTPLIVQQVQQLDIDVQQLSAQLSEILNYRLPPTIDTRLDAESLSSTIGGSLDGLGKIGRAHV